MPIGMVFLYKVASGPRAFIGIAKVRRSRGPSTCQREVCGADKDVVKRDAAVIHVDLDGEARDAEWRCQKSDFGGDNGGDAKLDPWH